MANGWLRLWRVVLDHPVFEDAALWQLFTWCLLKANYVEKPFRGQVLVPGSFITGRKAAAAELRIEQSKWYRGIQKLVALGCITTKSNSQWTTITVCNWQTYQSGDSTERTTDEQPADSERTTDEHNLRIKELKNSRTNPPPTPKGHSSRDCSPKEGAQQNHQTERVDEIVAAWNSTPFVKVQPPLDGNRRKALLSRLKEPRWVDQWQQALEKAKALPFCRGSNDRNWVATFAWFVRPETVRKLIEGEYGDGKPAIGPKRGQQLGPGQTYQPKSDGTSAITSSFRSDGG